MRLRCLTSWLHKWGEWENAGGLGWGLYRVKTCRRCGVRKIG